MVVWGLERLGWWHGSLGFKVVVWGLGGLAG